MVSKEEYELYEERHWELWDWLFHNPSKQKHDCPNWEWNSGEWKGIYQDCFACAVEKSRIDVDCNQCPMPNRACGGNYSYFNKWNKVITPQIRKKFAKLIRDAFWLSYKNWKMKGGKGRDERSYRNFRNDN